MKDIIYESYDNILSIFHKNITCRILGHNFGFLVCSRCFEPANVFQKKVVELEAKLKEKQDD